MKVATGLASGSIADPALAARAVAVAMERAGLEVAEAVLLYLSADFARDPRPAIAAAARAGNCLQVAGCSAAGVFTDEDWVLDAPAAAALVLGDGAGLAAARPETEPVLTLTAPNALDTRWLEQGGARCGGVAGDASGQGPFSVWSGGRPAPDGRCELAARGVELRVGVSQGVRPLGTIATIDAVAGQDIRRVDGEPALTHLARQLPLSARAPERIPAHLLMAGLPWGDPETAPAEGRYLLMPVIGVNADDKSVSVAGHLAPGQPLFWALRQPKAAERDMLALLDRMTAADPEPPDFGLLFPCMGRGPLFHGGDDADLNAVKARFPGLPLIGFYGNGEIARLDGVNRLLQYSVVLGLGRARRAD